MPGEQYEAARNVDVLPLFFTPIPIFAVSDVKKRTSAKTGKYDPEGNLTCTFWFQVKVTDFGLTRKVDTTVKYLEYVNNYHAAELCDTVVNEKLVVNKSTDIWALGEFWTTASPAMYNLMRKKQTSSV